MRTPETLARRAALDLEQSLTARDPERAAIHRLYAGHWLGLLRRHGLVPYKQWNHWLKTTADMGGEEARQLMSEFNAWQHANRFERSSLKFVFRELATTGWKPDSGDSPAFTEAMQEALRLQNDQLCREYDE